VQARTQIGSIVLVLAIVGSVFSSTAGAATRLGPDVSVLQNGTGYGCQAGQYSPCSYVNLRSTNPEVPVAAPFNGVITKWRFRAACCIEAQTESRTMTLKTFLQGTQDGLGGNGYIIPKTTGPSFVIPPGNQVASSPEVELPARVPIAAGERIGIVADHPIAFASYNSPNVTLTIVTNGTVYNGEGYGVVYGGAFAINADIEPDADGDGFGDETQDCQTGDPSQHGTECVAPPAGTTPPPLLSVGKSGPCEGVCGGGAAVFSRPPQSIPSPRGDGGIEVLLECPPGSTAVCGGILYAELPGGKSPRASSSKAAAPKILAKKKYAVEPGKKKTVKLTFSKKTLSFLALKRRRRVTVTIVPDQGQPVSTTKTLKFRRPAPTGRK
jgi:hypothetical protein